MFVRLNICSNSIGDKGLCKLAAVLKNNTTLKTLYIWGNKMGKPTCDVSSIYWYLLCMQLLKAFHELLRLGVLRQECVDVRPYVVDGVNYLAQIDNYT